MDTNTCTYHVNIHGHYTSKNYFKIRNKSNNHEPQTDEQILFIQYDKFDPQYSIFMISRALHDWSGGVENQIKNRQLSPEHKIPQMTVIYQLKSPKLDKLNILSLVWYSYLFATFVCPDFSMLLNYPNPSASLLNSLWRNCVTAQSHYQNQGLLFINEPLWHSPKSNFRECAQDNILYTEFNKYDFEIVATVICLNIYPEMCDKRR